MCFENIPALSARSGRFRLGLTLLLAFLLQACSDTAVQSVGVGDIWPQPELVDLNGKAVDPKAVSGKPMLLNVWATWCEPCRREMPDLQRLADAVAGAGVEVIGLSVDDDARPSTRSSAGPTARHSPCSTA